MANISTIEEKYGKDEWVAPPDAVARVNMERRNEYQDAAGTYDADIAQAENLRFQNQVNANIAETAAANDAANARGMAELDDFENQERQLNYRIAEQAERDRIQNDPSLSYADRKRQLAGVKSGEAREAEYQQQLEEKAAEARENKRLSEVSSGALATGSPITDPAEREKLKNQGVHFDNQGYIISGALQEPEPWHSSLFERQNIKKEKEKEGGFSSGVWKGSKIGMDIYKSMAENGSIDQALAMGINGVRDLFGFGGKQERIYKIPRIIGLPPLTSNFPGGDPAAEANAVIDTMPMLEIKPCVRKTGFNADGQNLYRLYDAWGNYDAYANKMGEDILKNENIKKIQDQSFDDNFSMFMYKNYNISLSNCSDRILKFCYLAESPISESFSNDYGSSFIENVTNGFRQETLGEFAQIAGMSDVSSGDIGKVSGKLFGKEIGDKVTSGINRLDNMGRNFMGKISGNDGLYNKIKSHVKSGAMGHGMDYPDIWKSSNFSPSYSFTIRLYNPLPGDQESTEKYIIGPLATIMSFVLPRTHDGHHYYYPWPCKFRVPGLIPWYPGYVKNVSIIKGGDHNQIAWNQRPAIVDVKIDFSILYNVMVSGSYSNEYDTPNLKKWLDEFANKRNYQKSSEDGKQPTWYGPYTSAEGKFIDTVLKKIPGVNKILGDEKNQKILSGVREYSGRAGNLYNQVSGTDQSTDEAVTGSLNKMKSYTDLL